MGKSSTRTVAPPDPYVTANAQAAANAQAVRETARVNAIDQHTPFGSTIYNRDLEGVPTSVRQNLNPHDAQALQAQRNLTTQGLNAAQSQTRYLPHDRFNINDIHNLQNTQNIASLQDYHLPQNQFQGNTSNYVDRAYQAYVDRASNSYHQQFDDAENDLRDNLAARGIGNGSSTYEKSLNRLQDQRTQGYNDLLNQAVLQSGQEAQRLQNIDLNNRNQVYNEASRRQALEGNLQNQALQRRAQQVAEYTQTRDRPYTELQALLQGSPIPQGQYHVPTPQYRVDAPDIQGAVQSNYQTASQNRNASQNYNARVGSTNSQLFLSLLALSHPDVKDIYDEDINALKAINKLDLKKWNYKNDAYMHYGVMADQWHIANRF